MKRGDIWTVDLNPGYGREIHKKRPVLIISNDIVHDNTNHVLIIPLSSQVPQKIGIEMVLIGKNEGLDKESVILPIFVRSIDKDRIIKKIGRISEEKLQEVEKALKLVLSLSEENL